MRCERCSKQRQCACAMEHCATVCAQFAEVVQRVTARVSEVSTIIGVIIHIVDVRIQQRHEGLHKRSTRCRRNSQITSE
jgi:hypothetical protein